MIKRKTKSISLTISGNPYGYGHFKRMKILKLRLIKKKILNSIVDVSKISESSLKKINLNTYKILFLDFSNKFFFKTKNYNSLISHLKKFKGKIFSFDCAGKKIIKLFLKNKRKAFLIFPYFSTTKIKNIAKKITCFIGPQYFLFDHIYMNKNSTLKLKKIFLSCGGLDKDNFTYKISKFIHSINADIEIHAVIGPLFIKKNINCIKKLKNNHMLFLYYSVSNLTKISQYCDLAIVSSGLTKYEMAASGINLAVYCEDANHAKLNQAFAESNTAYNLSNFSNLKLMEYKLGYMLKNYFKIFKEKNNNKYLLKSNNFNLIFNYAK